MNTKPGLHPLRQLAPALDVRGPDAGAEAELGIVATRSASSSSLTRITAATGRKSPRGTQACRRTSASTVGSKKLPAPFRRLPPVSGRAPDARLPDLALEIVDQVGARERTDLHAAILGVADFSALTAAAKSSSNSSATDSTTMKRLAAMQLWPLSGCGRGRRPSPRS